MNKVPFQTFIFGALIRQTILDPEMYFLGYVAGSEIIAASHSYPLVMTNIAMV